MTTTFASRLFEAVLTKQSPVVVGLDPDLAFMPPALLQRIEAAANGPGSDVRTAAAQEVTAFLIDIVDAVKDVVAAVKPQLAFFERLGPVGMEAYEHVIRYAHEQGLIIITDGKRHDVPGTAQQYAAAYLGEKGHGGLARDEGIDRDAPLGEQLWQRIDREGPSVDALTIGGYLGRDGVTPFIDKLTPGQGLFLLVKTSNPSSGDLQDLVVVGGNDGMTVADHVATWINRWNDERADATGYGPVGAVVGATYPHELRRLRKTMPRTVFLIPGFGAQGGGAADVIGGFDRDGFGALVNSSRGILYAYKQHPQLHYAEAARAAAMHMRDEIRKAGSFYGNAGV